jgi:hypothetical protein
MSMATAWTDPATAHEVKVLMVIASGSSRAFSFFL